MATHYDAIVIGTGQSGPSLAHRLAKEGRRVAIAERKRFGGTCVNANTDDLGLETAGVDTDEGGYIRVRVDMQAVKASPARCPGPRAGSADRCAG
jgi:pyruvate/2-oxoglutarate dehydrogenase complex dihydrolipoamide dehydrogenase (E3) component